MSDTCQEILAGWETQLEKFMLSRPVPEDGEPEDVYGLINKFCGDDSITRSCHGMGEDGKGSAVEKAEENFDPRDMLEIDGVKGS